MTILDKVVPNIVGPQLLFLPHRYKLSVLQYPSCPILFCGPVPNIVGVDIGCGMYTVELGNVEIDFAKLDEAAHFVPSGMNIWDSNNPSSDVPRSNVFVTSATDSPFAIA